MKKLKYLVVLLLGIVVITGCESNDKEKTMVCTRTINQDSISMNLKYTVTYKGEYVQQIESVEKVKTSDPTTLTTFKDTIEAELKKVIYGKPAKTENQIMAIQMLEHVGIETKYNPNIQYSCIL